MTARQRRIRQDAANKGDDAMKFPHLPVGEIFIWNAERFQKTGPVAATHLESGGRRLVPRSAEVTPDLPAAPKPFDDAANGRSPGLAAVTLALEAHQVALGRALAAHCPGLAPDRRDQLLRDAAREFWSALKILPK